MTDSLDKVLSSAMAQAFVPMLVTDAELSAGGPHIVFVNQAFCAMTGYSQNELLGQSPRVLQGADTDPQVLERLRGCLHQGEYFQGTAINYRKDGSPYWVEWNISPVRDQQGRISHYVSVQQDISSRMRAERERDLMTAALNATGASVMITDAQGRIEMVNRAFTRLSGYFLDELIGQTPALLKSGLHPPRFYAGLWQALMRGEPFSATFVNRRRDGSLYHASQSITPITNEQGRITHFVSICKDVSDMVRREHRLREQANSDRLTGLSNRHAGEEALHALWQQARLDDGRGFSVILADIDHFKRLNDTHGHLAGDRVLRAVARCLAEHSRNDDLAVRWGGEEFLLLLPGSDLHAALASAERLRMACHQLEDEQAGHPSLSFGVAEVRAGESIEQLIARADMALYSAKQSGRNQVRAAVQGLED